MNKMALQDIQVTIDIQRPSPRVGLGRPLILAESASTTSTYTEYASIDDLVKDYAETTTVYKKAAAVFAQANAPDIVAVATYSATGGGDPSTGLTIVAAFEKYFGNAWNFLLLPDAIASERLAVSNALEAHKFKFLVLKVETQDELAQYISNSRTICYYHPSKTGEELDAAIIGEAASLQVGSITWKFRKNLVGITPVDITSDDLKAIHAAGANMYVEKAGIPQTSEGITATGQYIDILHGQDWVKVNGENSLQLLLSDNDKIPSNSIGVSMASSVLTTVLTTATQNGIIEKDVNGNALFSVTATPIDQIPKTDREKRIYSGLSFQYTPQGAVHEMTVTGTIVEE